MVQYHLASDGLLDRLRAWIHQHSKPPGESAADTPATDAEVIAAWEPWKQVTAHSWRINPLLDLPLRPYAGMSRARVWELFVDWLVECEQEWILDDEQSWASPPKWSKLMRATLNMLTDAEADADHAERLAWWKENQEAPLRPSDPAAVSVWLWRNGLHTQAVGVFARIWQAVCAKQEAHPVAGPPGRTYPVDSRQCFGWLPPCGLSRLG